MNGFNCPMCRNNMITNTLPTFDSRLQQSMENMSEAARTVYNLSHGGGRL